ncbi:MAG: tripartite tricarboxylate transporter TctB family protein [Spirochaetaceae bacterium]|nr:tripartite tricarboxylate transporter TctB family protein [Spirochaetaceae bacterium]
MKKGNIITGILFSIFSIFVILMSLQLPPSKNGVPGPSTWPIAISLIMLLAAMTVLINAIKSTDEESLILNTIDHYRVYISMGILILYLLGMYYIGFCVASFFMLYAFFTWFGEYKLIKRILIATIIVAIVFFLFTKILHVPFRFGILF